MIGAGIRFEIFERDIFACVYCGCTPNGDGIKLHVDHVIPRSQGGTNDIFNLVTACQDCNLGKAARLIRRDSPVVAKIVDRSQGRLVLCTHCDDWVILTVDQATQKTATWIHNSCVEAHERQETDDTDWYRQQEIESRRRDEAGWWNHVPDGAYSW